MSENTWGEIARRENPNEEGRDECSECLDFESVNGTALCKHHDKCFPKKTDTSFKACFPELERQMRFG